MNTALHFSSETVEWSTPPGFFAAINAETNGVLGLLGTDVCATEENRKGPHFYTEAEDGLAQEWAGLCWMNPPYGRGIGAWVEKAWRSAHSGNATVYTLLPARTDTAWWHDYVMQASEIRLIRGRLKFGGCKNAAPFPSALVIFRPDRSTAALFKSYTLKPKE